MTDTNDSNNILIKIEHLKKSFGSNVVLSDINMTLQKGENVVIMGKSGEGKSVTIKCIVGLLNQDEGKLKVLGKEVKDLGDDELKQIRAKIGFLFQGAALYDSMTVRENLEFPLTKVLKLKEKAEINKRVGEILDSVGLPGVANKMPADLSGGMRKRIGLARTLILKPEIMLYDEPTTGLDPITAHEISELILKTQEYYKTSSVVITHDIACAKTVSDRILVMNKGKFVAEGKFDELKKSSQELVQSFFKNAFV